MKFGKRLMPLALALVIIFGLTVNASAADAAQNVTAKLSPNITVTLGGEAQAMADVNGNSVYPVLYNGTTYLPVRAVGNMLGVNVDWDQDTRTVLLTKNDSRTTPTKVIESTSSGTTPTDITVQINPEITVKYGGKTQTMKDTNGSPVYPMLYNGTTYLPVRAVSNMLGVVVDWDQAAQVILLNDVGAKTTPIESVGYNKNGITIKYIDGTSREFGTNETNAAYSAIKAADWGTYSAYITIKDFIETYTDLDFDYNNYDLFDGKQTSENAKQLGDKHIGYDWGEIDWSTANDGYVRVKINTQLVDSVNYNVEWYHKDDNMEWFQKDDCRGQRTSVSNFAVTDSWQNVPLWFGGEAKCLFSISISPSSTGYRSIDEDKRTLQILFTAKVDDVDSMWLMSNVKADYENSPNTCAKAKELTKNCKTDAEKITAVYNYVSSVITYSNAEWGGIHGIAERNLSPDHILETQKGVCEHYAVLMTAMLRSIGVPCKYVTGQANNGDGNWGGHAWVAVKPKTGTLNIPGVGKDYASFTDDENGEWVPADPTGWIRLDPTWAKSPSAAANDKNHHTYEYY